MESRDGRECCGPCPALRGMDVLWHASDAGLRAPTYACARNLLAAGAEALPHAQPAIVLGHAVTVAEPGIWNVCPHGLGGAVRSLGVLEESDAFGIAIWGTADRDRSGFASSHGL